MTKKRDKLVKGAWVVMTVSMLANLIYEFYWNRRISPLSVLFLVMLGVYVVGLLTGKTMVGDRRFSRWVGPCADYANYLDALMS